ncbi:MAG: sulfatase [Bryobacteraceae bacterium]
MTRKQFLKSLGAWSAAATLPAAQPDSQRPNFIFILCDDLGWGDLPSFGHRSTTAHGGWIVRGELKTPHLDRMAREGTRFTQFYVASAVCSPSRAAFMTGLFPGRVGIHDYVANPELNRKRGVANHLDPEVPTLTALLKQHGYATAHFGKWHLGVPKLSPEPERYGVDRYAACLDGPLGRPGSSGRIADEVIAFIDSNRDRPFFINAWLYDPHSPLHPTEEMMEPYRDLSPRWGDNKGAMQVYYGVLTEMDRHIGRILDKLDQAGLSRNTVVLFASDNGPESGLIPFTSHYAGVATSGPFRGIKRSLYEGGIRSPLIVRWPGKAPEGRVDDTTLMGGVDFLPTICRLAGVPPPANLDGEDLSDALRGKPRTKSKPLLWENRFPVYGHVLDMSPMLAIRSGRWKLLMNPDRSRVELFDIPKDPAEMDNLAARNPKVVAELSSKLLEWQKTLPKGPVDPAAGSNHYPWPRSSR